MPSIKIAANYIFGTSVLTGDLDRSGHLQIVYDDDDPSIHMPDFLFSLQPNTILKAISVINKR